MKFKKQRNKTLNSHSGLGTVLAHTLSNETDTRPFPRGASFLAGGDRHENAVIKEETKHLQRG